MVWLAAGDTFVESDKWLIFVVLGLVLIGIGLGGGKKK